ncbi:MAG: cyclase family protein [Gammaproteobacteria bacterium]
MSARFAVLVLMLLAKAAGADDLAAAQTAETMKPWWPSRYGRDDQIGTLNEIKAQQVIQAVRLVKTGTVVDLGRILDDRTPKFPGRYWHQTADATAVFGNQRRSDGSGKGWGKNRLNWITEIQAGTFQVGTQLDSIGHIQIGDRFYNGSTTAEVVESWGLNRYGIETVPPIVTRGILIDVAGYKGVARLEQGYEITLADVKGALARENIDVRSGDAVLFHTGWGELYGRDNAQFLAGEPGPGLEVVEWLYQRRIAVTGADTWSYGPFPGKDPERPFLVPQTMYVRMGLFGLENLATEELALRRVYEFLFVLTHGKTRGSTAAVVAPAAVY